LNRNFRENHFLKIDSFSYCFLNSFVSDVGLFEGARRVY